MSKIIKINKKIGNFNKTIFVPGDKSLSIRWVLFASLANGQSIAKNLLMSEDVLAAISTKKLGIKVITKKMSVKYMEKELMVINIKNLTINAENSGTLGRLILTLVNSPMPIKLIGDKSLSKEISEEYQNS